MGLTAFAKSIVPPQPARIAQAAVGRYSSQMIQNFDLVGFLAKQILLIHLFFVYVGIMDYGYALTPFCQSAAHTPLKRTSTLHCIDTYNSIAITHRFMSSSFPPPPPPIFFFFFGQIWKSLKC